MSNSATLPAHADVVLREDLPHEFDDALPAVVLSEVPLTARQFRWGVTTPSCRVTPRQSRSSQHYTPQPPA